MITKQNHVLTAVKDKILDIEGFTLVEETEKAIHFDFGGDSVNVEAQLDNSRTVTTIFITDVQQVIISNDFLKQIYFTDKEEVDPEIKMASILLNEVPIEMYPVIDDVEAGILSSEKYYYETEGFEKQDYKNYKVNFTCRGRELSLILEKRRFGLYAYT